MALADAQPGAGLRRLITFSLATTADATNLRDDPFLGARGSRGLGSGGVDLAPQSGHVSNFFGSVGDVIEPVDAYCFQNDSCEPLTCVHAGHPVWIGLELTKGAADNSRVRRHSGAIRFTPRLDR